MRDVFNPLMLLVIVLALAMRVTGADEEMARSLDLLMLTLCAVCCIMSGVLGVARMLVRRRAVMPIIWAGVYLIVGCCVWTISFQRPQEGEDRAAYLALVAQYRESGNPCARNEEGDHVTALAAALGEKRLLEEILQTHGSMLPMEVKVEAAHAAASAGKVGTLTQLLDAGVEVNARHESEPLLLAAAQNGMTDAMQLLLKRGADANVADDEGMTPLMGAAMIDRPTPVRLLLKHGADISRKDNAGRDAASYARSEDVASLLETPASQP